MSKKGNVSIVCDRVQKTVEEWAKETGLSVETILGRLNSGWTVKASLGRYHSDLLEKPSLGKEGK
jgi:hypothetical protein